VIQESSTWLELARVAGGILRAISLFGGGASTQTCLKSSMKHPFKTCLPQKRQVM